MIQLIKDKGDFQLPYYCLYDDYINRRSFWVRTFEDVFVARGFSAPLNGNIEYEILAEAPTIKELKSQVEELFL